MGTTFEELMANKTVEELLDFITNFDRYSPEAISAAVKELKIKGHIFSEEELKSIHERIKTKEIEEGENIFNSSKSLRKNVVTDPNAPSLYSQGAIMGFSIFFSALFGSVLLSLNIANTNQKLKVIGLGIVFTSLAVLSGNLVPHSTLSVLFFNGIGGYILTSDFWNRYIGKETKYRPRPIYKPLIISIIITILLLVSML